VDVVLLTEDTFDLGTLTVSVRRIAHPERTSWQAYSKPCLGRRHSPVWIAATQGAG